MWPWGFPKARAGLGSWIPDPQLGMERAGTAALQGCAPSQTLPELCSTRASCSDCFQQGRLEFRLPGIFLEYEWVDKAAGRRQKCGSRALVAGQLRSHSELSPRARVCKHAAHSDLQKYKIIYSRWNWYPKQLFSTLGQYSKYPEKLWHTSISCVLALERVKLLWGLLRPAAITQRFYSY